MIVKYYVTVKKLLNESKNVAWYSFKSERSIEKYKGECSQWQLT